jgi:transcriptional regulator with XRE-family HTH domain
MSKQKTAEDFEKGQSLGLALLVLRRSRGLTLQQVSALSDIRCPNLSRYETGHTLPRYDNLLRIMGAMDLPMTALDRAQQVLDDLMGKGKCGRYVRDNGAAPPEKRPPSLLTPAPSRLPPPDGIPELPRRAALRLAQEAGKAVAHCCLAFLELQAGGWERDGEPASLGSAARGE